MPINIQFISKRPYLSLLLIFLFSLAAFSQAKNIKIKTSINYLLPEGAPSVKALENISSKIGSTSIIEVIFKPKSIDDFKPQMGKMAKAIQSIKGVNRTIFHKDKSFLQKNKLLIFPEIKQLEELHQKVDEAIKEKVSEEMDLLGLDDDEDDEEEAEELSTEEKAAQEAKQKKKDDELFKEYDESFAELDKELEDFNEYFISSNKEYIVIQVVPDSSVSNMAENIALINRLESEVPRLAKKVLPKSMLPMKVELYGGALSSKASKEAIESDVKNGVMIIFILLFLVLMIFFKSLSPIPEAAFANPVGVIKALLLRSLVLFLIMIPLCLSILWTISLGMMTIGFLNLVTAFIFTILLGLGIDYGIHFLSRYIQERSFGKTVEESLTETQKHTGRASITAAITTLLTFLTLLLAHFRGFRDLGFLAGVGIISTLLAMYTVFPTLVILFERFFKFPIPKRKIESIQGKASKFPFPKTILLAFLCLTVFSIYAATQVQFQYSFGGLGNYSPKLEDVKQRTGGTTGKRGLGGSYILYDNEEQSIEGHKMFMKMLDEPSIWPSLRSYESIHTFVPYDQEKRIKLLKKIRKKLRKKRGRFKGENRKKVNNLIKHCKVKKFSAQDLPIWLQKEFRQKPLPGEKDGKIGFFARLRSQNVEGAKSEAIAFTEQFKKVDLKDGTSKYLAGSKIIQGTIFKTIIKDAKLIFPLASIVVFLILLLDFRSFRGALIAYIPLVSGMSLICAVLYLSGGKFNYFNMVAIPGILGIGIDSSIHIYHRFTESPNLSVPQVMKLIAPAVIIAAITDMIGFGGLLAANHRGLVSLGTLAEIGIFCCIFCCLLITPALMQSLKK